MPNKIEPLTIDMINKYCFRQVIKPRQPATRQPEEETKDDQSVS